MRLLRRSRNRNRTAVLVGAAIATLLVIPAIPSVRRYARMKRM